MFLWIAVGAVVLLTLPLSYFAYRLNTSGLIRGYKMLPAPVLLAVGVLMVIWSVNALTFSTVEKNWPITAGRILSATIKGERAPHPAVKYSYQVAGSTYTTLSDMDAPGFGTKAARLQTAREIVKQLEPGMSVKVHYNPENPQYAVLLVRPKWNDFIQYSVGIIFIALALAFFAGALLRNRSLSKQLDI